MRKLNLILIFCFLAQPAFAEEQVAQAPPVMIINLGNDILGLQQSDRYLTNNLSIGVVTSDLPAWLEKYFKEDPNTKYMLSLSQQMFTPENLDTNELIVDDRPYAGWLFVRVQSSTRNKNRLSTNAIEVGVVGPASMAEQLQIGVHKITGSEPARGWDNQLNNELGVNVIHFEAVGKRWDGDKIDNDIVVYAGGSLGNVQTHADVGAVYRVGINVPDDMAADYMGGNTIGTRQEAQDFSAYVFVGATGEYVVRDIFLDGNTFTDSQSVEKNNLVGAIRAGIIVAYRYLELGYSDTVVTEQFKNQIGPHHNGTIFIRFVKKI